MSSCVYDSQPRRLQGASLSISSRQASSFQPRTSKYRWYYSKHLHNHRPTSAHISATVPTTAMPRVSRHPKSHHASPQPAHSAPHIHPQPSTTAQPPRTNASLNLSVLQQHYPSTSQILTLAPFSVLYTFSPSTQSWEKCEVEGTLFVCALGPHDPQSNNQQIRDGEGEGEEEERYAVLILNRKGLDNFYLELCSAPGVAVEVEISAEFTILQAGDKVWGLWIYGEAGEGTSKTIAACAERVRSLEDGPENPEMEKQQSPHLPTLNHASAHHKQHPSISSPSPPPPSSPPPPTSTSKPHISPPDIQLDTKPERPPLPMFTPSADTQFFLSQGRGGLQQISRGRPAISKEGGEWEGKGKEEDTLGALFAKAEREFLGKGKL